MRWFFWLLLISNSLILYFGMQGMPLPPPGKPSIAPAVGQLSLLSEVASEATEDGSLSEPEPEPAPASESPILTYEMKDSDVAVTAQQRDEQVVVETEDTKASTVVEPSAESLIAPSVEVLDDEPVVLPAMPEVVEAPTAVEPMDDNAAITAIESQPEVKAPVLEVQPTTDEQKRDDILVAYIQPPSEDKAPVRTADSTADGLPEPAETKPPVIELSSPVKKSENPEVVANTPEFVSLITETVVCGAFGVFEKGSEGRQFIERLEGLDIQASLRRDEVEETVGYWVIIPYIDTRKRAIDTVKYLREQGIKDIRRFVREDKRHGISLGLFGKQRNAERREKELVAIGQEVEIKPRTKTKTEYWVDYRAGQDQLEQFSRALLDEKLDYKMEEYPCARIVSPKGGQ